jgi:acetyl esterase/lipase
VKQFLTLALLSLLACSAAQGQKQPCAAAGNNNDFLGIRTIRLWPGAAPEAKGKACEDTPTLTVFEPQQGHANGSAVVILPGGAYLMLAANLEGRQIADWFTARGFRAFVLSYRLSSNGYLLPVPLVDARRAVQLVRARAQDYAINPNHIVIIGFSAGGHLAALASTQFVAGKPEAEDPIERVSSRPDYLVLGYPWIGAISSDTSHLTYCKLFNVMEKCEALRAAYSPDLSVTKQTPPTFLFHTFNDETVPVEQGLRFYNALVKAGVPAEMHIFANGPHGTGLGKGDAALDQWPSLLETWLRAQGLLTQAPAATVKAGDSPGVPFKDGVEVSINGQGPYRFGLDTGSTPAFLIEPQLARQLNLPVTSQTHMHTSGNSLSDPPVDVMRIDTLQLAGHLFHHAIGIGFGNSARGVKDGQGTLGMGLFKDVVLKLDYPGDRLSVGDESLPEADGKRVLAYTDEHLHPIIPIVLGGISVQAKLDSGARGIGVDLCVPPQFAAQLKLLNRKEGKGTSSDILGHQFSYETATLDGNLIIGDLAIHHPTLLISDYPGYVNLGGIINRMVVSIDQKNHRLKLEMPAER